MTNNIWKIDIFSTPGNPSITHQEVVPDVVSDPPTNKIRSLTSPTINTTDNANLAAKVTTPQEEGYLDSYTTHVEAEFSETPKESAKFSTKDMPQRGTLP